MLLQVVLAGKHHGKPLHHKCCLMIKLQPRGAQLPGCARCCSRTAAGKCGTGRVCGRACTSETAMWRVSCHHQSALGASTRPTSASLAAPRAPAMSPALRSQRSPSRDVATPGAQYDSHGDKP